VLKENYLFFNSQFGGSVLVRTVVHSQNFGLGFLPGSMTTMSFVEPNFAFNSGSSISNRVSEPNSGITIHDATFFTV